MTDLTFGQRIVSFRVEHKMLQKELAEIVGISATALNYYEKDKREPNVITIAKLANALDVTGDELLGISAQKTDFTTKEREHIKKYRALDERGKKNVDAILESEHSQIVVEDAKTPAKFA